MTTSEASKVETVQQEILDKISALLGSDDAIDLGSVAALASAYRQLADARRVEE